MDTHHILIDTTIAPRGGRGTSSDKDTRKPPSIGTTFKGKEC